MITKTILPFKLETTSDSITSHAGLARVNRAVVERALRDDGDKGDWETPCPLSSFRANTRNQVAIKAMLLPQGTPFDTLRAGRVTQGKEFKSGKGY